MKLSFPILLLFFALTACSTCYECSEEVVQFNGNTPVDTQTISDEFCTADQSEIDARESEGASCKLL